MERGELQIPFSHFCPIPKMAFLDAGKIEARD